jgi:hypothetical protein
MDQLKTTAQNPNLAELWRRLGRLLLYWTLASGAAGAGAYAAAVLLNTSIGLGSYFFVATLLPCLFVISLALGFVQNRMLSGLLELANGWAWRGGWGMLAGTVIIFGVSAVTREAVRGWMDWYRLTFFLIGAGLAGVAAAWGQWRLLVPRLPKHQWWLLANAIGWLMAWLGVLGIGLLLGAGQPLPATADRVNHALILGGVAGTVIGFEQAVALFGLLAQQAWEQRKRSQPMIVRFE